MYLLINRIVLRIMLKLYLYGYTYFLLRGIEKVKGEVVMHCLMYNLKRVLNILGTDRLIAALRRFSELSLDFAIIFLENQHLG
jgi:two-component SAPR family response regulator